VPLETRYRNPPTTSHTIRYVTRSYVNVRSKADINQLNLPHGTKLKSGKEKN